jgi:RNA polymerase sigma-70 factor (ECF subfamily)
MGDRGQASELALIRQAQQGSDACRSRLAELATERVFAYIYRITLDYHLSQDLCQESLVRMLEYLPSLSIEHAGAFWAWMYRTAFSRIQQHALEQKRMSKDRGGPPDTSERDEPEARSNESVPDRIARGESIRAIWRAMDVLTLKHRQIVTLRCFEQLTYAEIAAITGGSQLQAKLTFFRAKKSLRRHLSRAGLGRSSFLSVLGLFAAVTAAPGKKAVAAPIAAASLQVGGMAALLGTIMSSLGAFLATTAAIAVVVAAAQVAPMSLAGQVDRTVGAIVRDYEYMDVALVRDANVVLIRSYGTPADGNRVSPFGGATPFAAILTLQFVEQGLIRSLDEDIGRYAPKYRDCMPRPFAGSDLTFRHLLSHRSGLLTGIHDENTPSLWKNGKLDIRYRPGAQRLYTCGGYSIVEEVLQHVSGKNMNQLIAERIVGADTALSLKARRELPESTWTVYARVQDLARFAVHLLEGRYIDTSRLIEQAADIQDAEIFSDTNLVRDPNGILVWHSCLAGADRAYLLIEPQRSTGLVLLARTRNENDGVQLARLCGRLMTIADR